MISLEKVQEIERLLAVGELSHRKIAKQTGVSRATVGGIAAGTRPDYVARQKAREQQFEEPPGPLVRCGGCGGRVYAPCRLCRIRAMQAAEHTELPAQQHGESHPSEPRRGLPIGRPPVQREPICPLAPEPRLAG